MPASLAALITAACPICTPSKKPSATAAGADAFKLSSGLIILIQLLLHDK
jgi:hypothetical protein